MFEFLCVVLNDENLITILEVIIDSSKDITIYHGCHIYLMVLFSKRLETKKRNTEINTNSKNKYNQGTTNNI